MCVRLKMSDVRVAEKNAGLANNIELLPSLSLQWNEYFLMWIFFCRKVRTSIFLYRQKLA
jgi:hypothetical protein